MNKAGPHPPYQTTNATAENIVANGNVPPIHGVKAARTRIATAMARSAIPYLEMVEGAVDIKKKDGHVYYARPSIAELASRYC